MSKYKDYKTDGIAVDQDWITRNRTMIESYIYEDMRAKGYVPVLDIPSDLHWHYISETNNFGYTIVVKGKWLGKSKARRYRGILANEGLILDAELGPQPLISV